jgi:hypothetical protein
MDDDKEKLRKSLLERYISTGKVGFSKPANDEEAIAFIETIVKFYTPEPVKMSLTEMSAKFKDMLDF